MVVLSVLLRVLLSIVRRPSKGIKADRRAPTAVAAGVPVKDAGGDIDDRVGRVRGGAEGNGGNRNGGNYAATNFTDAAGDRG